MKTLFSSLSLCAIALAISSCAPKQATTVSPETLLLKDYAPETIFKLPEHHPTQAKFSVIDMHSHAYKKDIEGVKEWAKIIEENNLQRVVVHTMAHGERFEELYDMYKSVSDKFELWCGLNYEAWGTPDFEKVALADLERCAAKGAKGVGELGDKGLGESFCTHEPSAHFNDPCFDAIIDKCGELGLPINFHAGDPIWMYEPLDEHNDGYMNAANWAIDLSVPGMLNLDEVVATFLDAVKKHPNTTFIAAHLINLSHDYERLGAVLDTYPNLYIDNSARHLETCATPRATKKFYEKYQDRIVFGTDNDPERSMYRLEWRILETEDEHFYAEDGYSYHWPLHGLGLSDDILKKVYHDNAVKIMGW